MHWLPMSGWVLTTPAQAISAALSKELSNFDASLALEAGTWQMRRRAALTIM